MPNLIEFFQNFDWNHFLNEVLVLPFFWGIVGAILFLLYLWRTVRKRRRIIRLFNSESGSVAVSRSALELLIQNMCFELGPNCNPRVYIRTKDNRLFIKVKVHLFTHQHVENTSIDLQQKITTVLKENLGIEQIGSINILVTGFTEDRPSPKEATVDTSDVIKEDY